MISPLNRLGVSASPIPNVDVLFKKSLLDELIILRLKVS
jgi:hypothetical protein